MTACGRYRSVGRCQLAEVMNEIEMGWIYWLVG